METRIKIEYRKQTDDEAAPWLVLTNIDELIWNGVYALRVNCDDGTSGLPFRFENSDTVTLVVKDHAHEGELQHGRTVVQTVTRVERSTANVFIYTRTRCNVNGEHLWTHWTLAADGAAVIEIPKASSVLLGGVMIGKGLSVDNDGKVSLAEHSVSEKELCDGLNERICSLEAKAEVIERFSINDGILLHFGALVENDTPYSGTAYNVYCDKVLANGETVVVNRGYRISAVKIFDGRQEILFDDTLNHEEYTLDQKGCCYQFAFSKADKNAFVADELCRVIKSFVRNTFTWNNLSDIDTFVAQGTYDINGVSGNLADGLPINNTGAIRARLTVLAGEECVTQVLALLNVGGGDGNVYTRTMQGDEWSAWGKLQSNIEVGKVGSLDSFIDNGIYSGVWTNGFNGGYPVSFVCITLNDYAVNVSPRRVSQLVYSLSKNDGAVVCRTRVGVGDDTVVWGGWKDVNEENIKALVRGTDEKSSAWHDAFRHLGDFQSMDELLATLDFLHGTSGAERDTKCGFFSARIPNARFFIINSCVNFFQDNWQQCLVGNVYLNEDGTIDSYLDKGCGVLYRTHLMPAGYEYPVDPNNGYAHNWSGWKIANEDQIKSTAATVAQKTEAELIKRIQGKSTESSPGDDAFKYLGTYSSIESFLDTLNTMQGSTHDATLGFRGHFRARVTGYLVDIYSEAVGFTENVWTQEIRAPFEPHRKVVKDDVVYPIEGNTAIYHLARKYAQELRLVSGADNSGGVRTLRRMCHNGVWREWVDTANPYISSPLYGKNLLVLGGSFAHNMRGGGVTNAGFGFMHMGREYSMQNYIADVLGLNRFDNFAVAGCGACIDKFDVDIHTQLVNALNHANAKGYKYDAVMIMGGINDYAVASPLGALSETMGDSTFYASYKKIINTARTANPDLLLFLTTPFKAFSAAEYWNSTNATVNAGGHKYLEYVQAIKDIAQFASAPLLDIYAIQQVDTNNYGEFYRVTDNDSVHPNGKGYKLIAPAMLEFLAWGKGMETFDNEALTIKLKDKITVEKERAEQAEAEAVEKGKKLALRALYIAAGAEYNDSKADKTKTAPWGETVVHKAGHYYLNGLGDITEEQMLKIYDMRETLPMIRASATAERWFQGIKADYRTFFPIKDCNRRIEFSFFKNGYYAFKQCSAEVLKWTFNSGFNYYPASLTGDCEGIFSDMQNLRFIDSLNASGGLKQYLFLNCFKLEFFRIIKLKNDISFKDSPLLDKECLAYSINKAAPTSAITITLHADAYARIADDVDIVAALEAQPLVSLVSA